MGPVSHKWTSFSPFFKFRVHHLFSWTTDFFFFYSQGTWVKFSSSTNYFPAVDFPVLVLIFLWKCGIVMHIEINCTLSQHQWWQPSWNEWAYIVHLLLLCCYDGCNYRRVVSIIMITAVLKLFFIDRNYHRDGRVSSYVSSWPVNNRGMKPVTMVHCSLKSL